jgi:hypothetical protein
VNLGVRLELVISTMKPLGRCIVVVCTAITISCGSKSVDTPVKGSAEDRPSVAPAAMPVSDGVSGNLQKSSAESFGNVEMIGTVTAPLSSAEAMSNIVVSTMKPNPIVGWAVDSPGKALSAGIEVVIDGLLYKANYGLSRPDVAAFLKSPVYAKSGYSYVLPAGSLRAGVHSLEIRALSADSKRYFSLGPFKFRAE